MFQLYCKASDNDSLLDLKCVISLRRWQCTKYVAFSKMTPTHLKDDSNRLSFGKKIL